MPKFAYRSVGPDDKVEEGVLDAADRAAAAAALQGLGHLPIRIDVAGSRSSLMALLNTDLGRSGLSDRDLTEFIKELATLLSAGIGVEQALALIADMADRPAVREVTGNLLSKVRGGKSLSQAMQDHADSFPGHVWGLVRAGEAGAALPDILNRLAGFLQKSAEIRAEVRSAMIYPAFLCVAAVASVAVLLGFVIPNFKLLFAGANVDLPATTRIVLGAGDAFQAAWPVLLAAVVLAAGAWKYAKSQPGSRLWLDRAQLNIPLLGPIALRQETALLCRTLGALLKGGVPLVNAMDLVEATLDNHAMRRCVADAGSAIRTGASLSEATGQSPLLPGRALRLIRVGEESGDLARLLDEIALIYDGETRQAIKSLLAMLVPALTVVFGILTGFIIFSILTALLSINELAF